MQKDGHTLLVITFYRIRQEYRSAFNCYKHLMSIIGHTTFVYIFSSMDILKKFHFFEISHDLNGVMRQESVRKIP